MLTLTEAEILEDLGKLYTRIHHEVVIDGPAAETDRRELCFHFNAIQRMIGAQAAAREYPLLFRLLGGDGVGPKVELAARDFDPTS